MFARQRFWGFAGVVILLALLAYLLPSELRDYPESWVVPLSDHVGRALEWFARDASIAGIAVQDISRGLAALVDKPIQWLTVLLSEGVVTGSGFNKTLAFPPLSWIGLLLVTALFACRCGGWQLGLTTLLSGFYLLLFGLWTSAMLTLASVLVSVSVAGALGLAIGIASFRNPRTEQWARGVMNVMQTVPIFAYLVPTLLLFGYGPSAALIATVIYALPPMVHSTVLALRSVPEEVREYGTVSGCTPSQLLWRVELPVALPTLAIGINQVVMMSLNMVIIASMIGAGGLGYDVLRALRKLDIGHGIEAGMGIVVLAVVLDRIGQSLARQYAGQGVKIADSFSAFWKPGRWTGAQACLFYVLILSATTLLSLKLAVVHTFPSAWTITTAPWWNDLVSYINVTYFDVLETVRVAVLLNLMYPLRDALQAIPWSVMIIGVSLLGWQQGGYRLALLVAGLLLFIVLNGYWSAAMVSLYLIVSAVLVALAIGFPLGIWLAGKPSLERPTSLVLDTLQTLPTLVYLLPAVMLFRNGDFSALLAIMLYAIAPVIRYTMHGLQQVPEARLEAAQMAGCTRWQSLIMVRLPSATSTLILGLNQTIMMALSMLVIAALVGTRDLGQEVYIALTQAKIGSGIIAGLSVAALALVFDGLLKAWAANTQRSVI